MRSLTYGKILVDVLSSSSSSSPSPVSTPTQKGLFLKLKDQQRISQNNITTYFAGQLQIVEYPLFPGGERVTPCLVSSVLRAYEMPQLYCFHEEEAYIHHMDHGTLDVAECSRREDKCGYYVNFNAAHQNKDGPAKLYEWRQSIEATVNSTHGSPMSDEFRTPGSNNVAGSSRVPNPTPSSSGPVRTPRRRGFTSTASAAGRSPQKKTRIAEHPTYTLAKHEPTSTPAPTTHRESTPHDYSQPPYTQKDPPNSTYNADIFHPIHELMLDLESPLGLKKTLFWHYFKECEDCGYIARADVHDCSFHNPFEKADEVSDEAMGNEYEGDEESSPIRDGNTASAVDRKMLMIDLTVDDSD